MQGTGNGCLMVWVAGALLAAILTGLGSRDFAAEGGSSTKPEKTLVVSAGEGSAEHADAREEFGAEALVLDRDSDGHFYADTRINGQTIRMLVDTGASAIALAREDARRAGVGVSIGMPQVVGQGASGDVHGEVVYLERVALGTAEAENMAAVVLDEGEISLLGQSFLSKFESVEIRDDQMVLR